MTNMTHLLKPAVLSAAIFVSQGAVAPDSIAADRPNVIVILADDISANEFPLHGVPEGGPGNQVSQTGPARTPNLDRLAAEGAWAKTAWATPICSPSRAMIMTGRYAHRHGWYHNSMKTNNFYESSTDSTGQRQIIGHVAQQAGYATVWAGKTQIPDLNQYGFDEGIFYSGYNERLGGQLNPYSDFQGRVPYDQASWNWKPKLKRMNHPDSSTTYDWAPANLNGTMDYGQDLYLNTIFDFINRHTDDPTTADDDGEETQPFFAYYTPNLGHDAINFLRATKDGNGDYACNSCPAPAWPGTPELILDEQTGRWSRAVQTYQQQANPGDPVAGVTEDHIERHVEYLDYQVQQITDELDRLGIADNTVLIFTSDNGSWGYGKGSIHKQRGTHVPFIVHAPGRLAVQGEQDILVDLTDILPTLADITGIELPADYAVDGESVWSYLTGESSKHREWISSYYQEHQMIRGKNVLMDGDGVWYDTRGASDGDSFSLLTADSDPELLAEKRMLELALEGLPGFEESQFSGTQSAISSPENLQGEGVLNPGAVPEASTACLTTAAFYALTWGRACSFWPHRGRQKQ